MIVRRFLNLYPPASIRKVSLVSMIGKERFLQFPYFTGADIWVAGMPKEKRTHGRRR